MWNDLLIELWHSNLMQALWNNKQLTVRDIECAGDFLMAKWKVLPDNIAPSGNKMNSGDDYQAKCKQKKTDPIEFILNPVRTTQTYYVLYYWYRRNER